MRINNKDYLVQEATRLLERWARKKNLLPKGKTLHVSVSIRNSALVNLTLQSESSDEMDKALAQSISTLKLSNRAQYSMICGCVYTVGDLARKTEEELLRYRNLGKKTLKEIKDKLLDLGLFLGPRRPVVGPLERESAIRGPFHPYVHCKAIRPLEAAGIINLDHLILMTEDEIVSILKDCDLGEIGDPRIVYHDMRRALMERGLI